jgi:hypothetical protein
VSDLGDALLEAHVHHELSRLRGNALAALVEERVAAAFAWLEGVTFNQIVTPDQIVGVVRRYAIELPVSGGITELTGEVANIVFSSKSSYSTRVGDIVEPSSYEEFADKVVALEGVQRELIRYIMQSAAFGTLASRVLSRVVLDLLFRTDETSRGPRLKELALAFGQNVLPGIQPRLGAVLSRYIERHATRFTRGGEAHLLEAVDREWVRQMADEIWDTISKKPLAEAGTVFTTQDLEDFVVMSYEFWLKFRKSPYFLAIATEVVHHLFDKYGDESVASLILDMGVTEQMVAAELRTFLGPLVEHAFRTGFLEREIRAHLEPFYRSEEALAVLRALGSRP